MAKKTEKKTVDELLKQIGAEAAGVLARPVAEPNRQLWLFDEFADYNAELAAKNPKNEAGLTWAQEVFAQLVARGYSKTESYRLAYPNATTQNLQTIYPKASRLAKEGKVGARIDAVRAQLTERALMPATEFFARITDLARKGDKESLFKIGQIHGVFKPDKDVSVNLGTTLVVQTVDYAAAAANKTTADKTRTEQATTEKPAAGTEGTNGEAAK